MDTYDVIVIGSGAAGFTAGIYAVRYNLKTLLIGKETGGQMAEAYEVDNYPGLLNIKGLELGNKFREHAEKLGVKIELFSEVKEIRKDGKKFRIKTDGGKEFSSKSVIFATGSKKRKLGIPREEELAGRGVSYCATCDGPFFKDKTIAVIGGGNAAVKSAVMLAEHAKRVYLIYRKGYEKMKAMPYWKEIAKKSKKIEMIFDSVPHELAGREKLEGIRIRNSSGKETIIEVEGMFVEIGSLPETSIAKNLGVKLDDKGLVVVRPDMSTNVKGFFAAGDMTTGSNHFEQIITSAAEGAIAANSAYNYLRGE
jgi:thioredoxin reductase (NADPH)